MLCFLIDKTWEQLPPARFWLPRLLASYVFIYEKEKKCVSITAPKHNRKGRLSGVLHKAAQVGNNTISFVAAQNLPSSLITELKNVFAFDSIPVLLSRNFLLCTFFPLQCFWGWYSPVPFSAARIVTATNYLCYSSYRRPQPVQAQCMWETISAWGAEGLNRRGREWKCYQSYFYGVLKWPAEGRAGSLCGAMTGIQIFQVSFQHPAWVRCEGRQAGESCRVCKSLGAILGCGLGVHTPSWSSGGCSKHAAAANSSFEMCVHPEGTSRRS